MQLYECASPLPRALYLLSCVFLCCAAGALFRVYPGPWQVLRRDRNGLRVVHTQETMPSLKEVSTATCAECMHTYHLPAT